MSRTNLSAYSFVPLTSRISHNNIETLQNKQENNVESSIGLTQPN